MRTYRRQGTIIVHVAVLTTVLLTFAALVVDIGLIYTGTSDMQRTADSSALAGASGLMVFDSRPRVHEFAYENPVLGLPVIPSELEIQIGNWDGVARAFSETPDTGIGGVLPNAVHVVGTRRDVALRFAPIIGHRFCDVRRGATALAGGGHCVGIWGIEGVTLDGDLKTDSYDSIVGPYEPTRARPNGDVCSCRDIVTNGGISVHGDAMYGEGYSFIPYGTSYEVLGYIGEHPCGVPPTDINYAWAASNNNNASIPRTFRNRDPFQGQPYRLYVTGNDYLRLPPGTFYFNSALLDGQAYLEVTGPTRIYIDGNAELTGGGILNPTRNPRNLVIYARGPRVLLHGTASFYGALMAPTALVQATGTFDAYGVVLARFLDLDGNMEFHVDEQLVFDLFGIRSIAPVLVE